MSCKYTCEERACYYFDGLKEDDPEQFWCNAYHRFLQLDKEDPDTCPKNPANQ